MKRGLVVTFRIVFAAVILVGTGFTACLADDRIAPAQDSSVWRSGVISVAGEGADLIEVKGKAVAAGRREAFAALMGRLLSPEELEAIEGYVVAPVVDRTDSQNPGGAILADAYLEGMQYLMHVDNEKIGSSRYLAGLTFVFDRHAVLSWLRGLGIDRPFVAPETVLLALAPNGAIPVPQSVWLEEDRKRFPGRVKVFFDPSLTEADYRGLASANLASYEGLTRRNRVRGMRYLGFESPDTLVEYEYRDGALRVLRSSVGDDGRRRTARERALDIRESLERAWQRRYIEGFVDGFRSSEGRRAVWRVEAPFVEPGLWHRLRDDFMGVDWIEDIRILELDKDTITFEFVSTVNLDETLKELALKGYRLRMQDDETWILEI